MKGQSEAVSGTDASPTPDEQQLLREIAHYDQKALEYTRTDTPVSRALATVYRYSADEKREILAALRDRAVRLPSNFPY